MKVTEKAVLYGEADVMGNLEYLLGEQGAASVREFAGVRPLRSLVFSGEELSRLKGMTSKRAALLIAAIRVGREDTVTPPIKCSGPDDSFKLLQDMQHLQQEEMRVVLLNTRCEVLRIVKVAMGASNACGVRLADVFRPAIAANAVRIVYKQTEVVFFFEGDYFFEFTLVSAHAKNAFCNHKNCSASFGCKFGRSL